MRHSRLTPKRRSTDGPETWVSLKGWDPRLPAHAETMCRLARWVDGWSAPLSLFWDRWLDAIGQLDESAGTLVSLDLHWGTYQGKHLDQIPVSLQKEVLPLRPGIGYSLSTKLLDWEWERLQTQWPELKDRRIRLLLSQPEAAFQAGLDFKENYESIQRALEWLQSLKEKEQLKDFGLSTSRASWDPHFEDLIAPQLLKEQAPLGVLELPLCWGNPMALEYEEWALDQGVTLIGSRILGPFQNANDPRNLYLFDLPERDSAFEAGTWARLKEVSSELFEFERSEPLPHGFKKWAHALLRSMEKGWSLDQWMWQRSQAIEPSLEQVRSQLPRRIWNAYLKMLQAFEDSILLLHPYESRSFHSRMDRMGFPRSSKGESIESRWCTGLRAAELQMDYSLELPPLATWFNRFEPLLRRIQADSGPVDPEFSALELRSKLLESSSVSGLGAL